MAKIIQFLILGLLIIHISESSASISEEGNKAWKNFITEDITLSQFVDKALKSKEYENGISNKIN
jgi:hypothetical protein